MPEVASEAPLPKVEARMVEPDCVQEPLGIPPGTPAALQSIARVGSRIPDQACACATPGTNASTMRRNKGNCARFIWSPKRPDGLATPCYICMKRKQSYVSSPQSD